MIDAITRISPLRRRARAVALAGALLAAALAAACSSGGKKPAASASAPASVSAPASTAPPAAVPSATGVPLTAGQQTVVAQAGAPPLVPYTDRYKRFTVQIPKGWDLSLGMENATSVSLPGTISAVIGIYCAPGISADALVAEDVAGGTSLNTGVPNMTQATPTQVAGNPARLVEWSSHLGQFEVQHVTLYFEGKGCAWRLQLNAWPGTDLGEYRALFDSVVKSFTLL